MKVMPFSGHEQECQWPKSIPCLKAEEPRHNLVFCAHASPQQYTLSVSDTFFRLCAATEPKIHFHAGASLTTTDGRPPELACISIRSRNYLKHAQPQRAL